MDYFSVIILVIVTLVFVSDRSIKSIDAIEREMQIDLYAKIKEVKNNLKVEKVNIKNMDYTDINKLVQNSNKKYVFIQNDRLSLNEKQIDTCIANYILGNQKPCGFNLLYTYKEKRRLLKRIYIDVINYLNIFNREQLSTYGIIICGKQHVDKDESEFKNSIMCYTPSEITEVQFVEGEIKKEYFKTIYAKKISEANVSIIIKILLLIFSGTIITSNLIYNILNVHNISINNLILSIVIYYCYSYILRYIYKPIGKHRYIATYIFPVYFACYIVLGIISGVSAIIKKVQAS